MGILGINNGLYMGIPNKSKRIYIYIHVFAYLSPRVIHHSWPLISKLVKLSFGQGYLSFSPPMTPLDTEASVAPLRCADLGGDSQGFLAQQSWVGPGASKSMGKLSFPRPVLGTLRFGRRS
jgi:hypothetical protein